MTEYILVIVPNAAYAQFDERVKDYLKALVRSYLTDKTSEPISGVGMQGPQGSVRVSCFHCSQVSANLTPEAIETLNLALGVYGIEILATTDPHEALAAMSIHQIVEEPE